MYFFKINNGKKNYYLKFQFCENKCIVTENYDERTTFACMEDLERAANKFVVLDLVDTFKLNPSHIEIGFEN